MTALDTRALRNAFGSYMTGVTIVTTRTASGQSVGFTANSFASVSLDPPLLLVCPGKFLSTHDAFVGCPDFAVNVLTEGQEDVSNTFASFKGNRFARVPHHTDARGNPLIDGALARFSCVTEQVLDAGDHSILIGKVQTFTYGQGRGLGYASGLYFSLGLERAALDHPSATTICGAIIRQGKRILLERTPDGYRPPQISVPHRGRLRKALVNALALQGLPAHLDAAYSVFDDDCIRYTYFLGTTAAAPTGRIEAVAASDLPDLSYPNPAIAEMMTRFALEIRRHSFGFYLGDGQRGDVHTPSKRT